MFHGLAPAECKKWMGVNVNVICVEKGAAVWVPFGYVTWMISTSPGLTFTAILPVLSDYLWKKTLEDTVRNQMAECFHVFLDSTGEFEPWCSSRVALRKWVGSAAP
jgi:hypothetical protein